MNRFLPLLLILIACSGCENTDKTMPGDAPPVMKRYVQMLDLKNDTSLIAEYVLWHTPDSIWKEIPAGIRQVGIRQMQIWLLDNKLCMMVETPKDFDWPTQMTKLGGLPRQAEWEAFVAKYQQASSGASSADKWRLMERIFSLRNSRESDAGTGYPLARLQSDAKRYCQTLELVNKRKLIEEYKMWHRRENIWKEITAGIKEVGILDMEIYLLGTRLYMIVDTPGDFDWDRQMQKLAKLPRQPEWEKFVSKFQKADPASSSRDKWKMMRQIFRLTDCP
jgi:L-rhamnose mutarotase